MTPHPAKFSKAVLEVVDSLLIPGGWVLDPFAGVGGIHALYPKCKTVGIELEPEWALQHERTMVGNALNLLFPDATFDAVATSPCYGNRMADHHDAKDASSRITYKHKLGRDLTPGNSGAMQWGDEYRHFHVAAWVEAVRVLKPNGQFILNISNHIRNGKEVGVSDWHAGVLGGLGLEFLDLSMVPTQRMRFGANADKRVETGEYVMHFMKGNY
jgi:tRNA G10  N-methylase Trm11